MSFRKFNCYSGACVLNLNKHCVVLALLNSSYAPSMPCKALGESGIRFE